MSAEYSVEEVRAHAAILRDWRNGFDPGVGNDDAAGMLDDHADLLERIKADESAVPDGYTALLSDGKRYWSDRPGEYGDWQPYFLGRPSAQAAQLWEMKQRACRAHALCNELRLAHPEIPELGDDGVLHEAIHDILRVDTPTASPAQAAQVDPLDTAVGWLDMCGGSVGEVVERLAAEPVAQGEADELIAAYDDAVRSERESGFLPPLAQKAARDCVSHNRSRLRKALAAQPRAVPADFAGYLKDPANVHVMMLRGVIAIPSIRSIVHLRGEVPNGEDALLERIAELQEQVATLKDKPAERVPDAKAMAYRFMGWRLPDDFRPDAGISFTPPTNPAWWPIGTNLLHVGQAEQMFRYVLAAAPSPEKPA